MVQPVYLCHWKESQQHLGLLHQCPLISRTALYIALVKSEMTKLLVDGRTVLLGGVIFEC